MTITATQPPTLEGASPQEIRAATEFLTPGAGDFSVALLDKVFGPGWQYLAGTADPVGASSTITNNTLAGGYLFTEIIGALNTVALAGLTIMFVVIMATGVLGTAHEGEPLGKRYSTLWTPLRASISVAMLAPLPWAGGYSLIQTLLLLATSYGIGGANVLNAVAMQHLANNQGIIFQVQGNTNAQRVIANSLQSATVLSTVARLETGSGKPPGPVYRSRWVEYPPSTLDHVSNSFRSMLGMETEGDTSPATRTNWQSHLAGAKPCQSRGRVGYCEIQYLSPASMHLPDGVLGTARIECEQPTTKLCGARLAAWAQAQRDAYKVAEVYSQPISTPNKLQVQGGFFDIMRRNYAVMLQSVGAEQLATSNANRTQEIQNLGASINRMGWASLGAYYLKISHINEDTVEMLDDLVKTEQVGPDLELIYPKYLGPEDIDSNLTSVKFSLMNEARASTFDFDPIGGDGREYVRGSAVGEKNELWGAAEKLDMFNPVYGGLKLYVGYLTSGDPASNLSTVGHVLLNAVTAGVAAYTVTRTTAKSASELTRDVPLIGRGVRAVSTFVSSVWEGPAGLLLSGLLITLLISAIMLAFYLPLVPFILWLFALIGWFILVIEVIVAAPLWAIAHGLPEGEGWAGNHGKQGYMLFLRVLLRPALMVVGFFVAMIAFNVIGGFIGEGFLLAYNSNVTVTGLFAATANIAILTIICVMVTHKLYGLITWLPDNLLNWIGQNHVNLGEGQNEGEARNLVVGAVQRIQGATSQALHNNKLGNRDGGNGGGGGLPGVGTDKQQAPSADHDAHVDVAANRQGNTTNQNDSTNNEERA